MQNYKRQNSLFSLCGLNCGLCSMKLGGYCPGCGQGNKPCKAAKCSLEHDVEYCFQCNEYPCPIYDHADESDSFITHKNQMTDSEKAKQIGIEAYNVEQTEKVKLLNVLLSEYNSGREKTLYCLAVNLFEVDEIKSMLKKVLEYSDSSEISLKEKAVYVSNLMRQLAQKKNVELKLRKR